MSANAEFTAHPAANIFSQMNQADYERLKADIVANGLREKIVTYQDQILDGRNRYRACTEAGIEPNFRAYEGDDPIPFVLSMNLHRRHLSASQRAMIAAGLATSKRGGDRSKAQKCALTHAQAAQQFSISERQVDKASALLNAKASGYADAELVEQLRDGKISLSKAEKLVRLRKKPPREVVTQNDCGTSVRAGTEERQSWTRQFDEVASQLERLCAQTADLVARAEKAGELTPERRKLLLGAWHNAPRWLVADTERQENMTPLYLMPCEEA
jgi:ParB-like chromosome segregation protein Spo0J